MFGLLLKNKMETYLCKLAYKYKSDKCKRFGKHTYTEYYYNIFNKKRHKKLKILEIGIGGKDGSSLKMWSEFFPESNVFGADYMQDRLINHDKIKSFLVDQRRQSHLKRLVDEIGPDIDIVIDDGSHRPNDQVFTCKVLMPLFKKSVLYIIEDVSDLSIVNRLKDYDVNVPILDQSLKRYDNNLVVIKNKNISKVNNLSFFAKPPTRVGHDRHLARVSTIIRAEQIAQKVNGKLNPNRDYENDICVYVKPPYKPEWDDLLFEGKSSYLDVVDELGYNKMLSRNPNINVISLSKWNYKTLKRLLPNKVINIPQQHCNFERYRRNSQGIKRIGMIGTYKAFEYLPHGIEKELSKRGIELVKFSKFSTREDIINFYMNIDLQIIWRPYYNYKKDLLVNPLKIVNSSSFGIPTIAYDEPAFEEMKGAYIPVKSLDDFLFQVDKLSSDHKLYKQIESRCIKISEKYHIDNIVKLYQNLK